MCNWLTNYIFCILGITEKTYRYDSIERLSETQDELSETQTEPDDDFLFVDDKIV